MTGIAARHAGYRARVLREGDRRALTRLAWGALMRLHQGLVYQPVWDGAPVLLDDWALRLVPVPEIPELAALQPRLGLVAAAGTIVRADQLAVLLHEALGAMETPRAGREFVSAPRGLDEWRRLVRIPNAEIVEAFAAAPVPGLCSLLLQGSLADGQIVDGYSDFDAVAILRVPPAAAAFQAQIEALLRMNHYLVAHNPAIHHGPMVCFDGYLNDAAEAVLPSAVLANSVLLAGEAPVVYYGDGTEEALLAIDGFERYFCARFAAGAAAITNGFDALWWISSATLIPLLEHQRRTGVSVWKREILPALNLPYLRRLTECRAALGEWMRERIGAERPWPLTSNVNPGVGAAHWRQRLRLDRNIGIDDWLVNEVRAAIRSAAAIEPFRPVKNHPRSAAPAEYDSLRRHWLAAASAGVDAVYEFGSVGCPGLSDLDLLLVVPDGAGADRFTLALCDGRQRELMGHDPMVVSREAMAHLPFVLPLVSVRRLAGSEYPLALADTLPADVVACAMTAYNFRKYPSDIEDLAKSEVLDFHLILAYLHSFTHVAKMFGLLGAETPLEVEQCLQLDAALRGEFQSAGGLSAGVLEPVLARMRLAAQATIAALEAWWRRRLFAPEWPILPWLCAYLADPDAIPLFRNASTAKMLEVTEPYRFHKREFLAAMRNAGLAVDGYLADWRFTQGEQFRYGRFEFELALGGDPVGVADVTGTGLSFTARGGGAAVRLSGWSSEEDWGTWAVEERASLAVRTAGQMVRATGRALVLGDVSSQTVEVRCNGALTAEWRFVDNQIVELPPFAVPPGVVVIEFRSPDARSPKELGFGGDGRRLGLGLVSLVFYDGRNE